MPPDLLPDATRARIDAKKSTREMGKPNSKSKKEKCLFCRSLNFPNQFSSTMWHGIGGEVRPMSLCFFGKSWKVTSRIQWLERVRARKWRNKETLQKAIQRRTRRVPSTTIAPRKTDTTRVKYETKFIWMLLFFRGFCVGKRVCERASMSTSAIVSA